MLCISLFWIMFLYAISGNHHIQFGLVIILNVHYYLKRKRMQGLSLLLMYVIIINSHFSGRNSNMNQRSIIVIILHGLKYRLKINLVNFGNLSIINFLIEKYPRLCLSMMLPHLMIKKQLICFLITFLHFTLLIALISILVNWVYLLLICPTMFILALMMFSIVYRIFMVFGLLVPMNLLVIFYLN